MESDRRSFLKWLVQAGETTCGAILLEQLTQASSQSSETGGKQSSLTNGNRKVVDARAYLETVLYTREEVDQWIAGATPNHEKYDGEIGWIPQPGYTNNGVHGCRCEYSYEPSGARRMTSFAGKQCRIDTYGDSFTHCDQVSDGETWQERIASHLCEPIQNFGISGNSIFQAYIRIKREEARTPTGYIILNIHAGGFWSSQSPWASLGIPRGDKGGLRRPTLPYTKVNPATGEFVECENLCPTPESLYNLCDLDWTYEHFKDEFQLQIILARDSIQRQIPEASYEEIRELARTHGIDAQIGSAKALSNVLDLLWRRAAVFGNFCIIERLEEFAAASGKKVFYVLSHTVDDLAMFLKNGVRFDQELVDFLAGRKLPYVDDLDAHRADFSRFNLSINDYLGVYYNGHYTPAGNFFQAFAIKDRLIELLVPKPPAYSSLV